MQAPEPVQVENDHVGHGRQLPAERDLPFSS